MNTKLNINQKMINRLESLAGEKLTFGSLIKAIRQSEEMSQIEFASLLGISKQYLCDVEKGRKFVSPKKAAEYAKKLRYSKEQFVRLCVQDLIDRDGLNLIISVEVAA